MLKRVVLKGLVALLHSGDVGACHESWLPLVGIVLESLLQSAKCTIFNRLTVYFWQTAKGSAH
jgi:hypothetical protein